MTVRDSPLKQSKVRNEKLLGKTFNHKWIESNNHITFKEENSNFYKLYR